MASSFIKKLVTIRLKDKLWKIRTSSSGYHRTRKDEHKLLHIVARRELPDEREKPRSDMKIIRYALFRVETLTPENFGL